MGYFGGAVTSGGTTSVKSVGSGLPIYGGLIDGAAVIRSLATDENLVATLADDTVHLALTTEPAKGPQFAYGEYTGNGNATGPEVALGFQARFILIRKQAGGSREQIWVHGMGTAISNDTVYNTGYITVNATGFQITVSTANLNTNGVKYSYVAIG